MKQTPSQSIKLYPETMRMLNMLKGLTKVSKAALMDTAVNLMVNQFKKTGTLEFKRK